jgi:hypothetical protein
VDRRADAGRQRTGGSAARGRRSARPRAPAPARVSARRRRLDGVCDGRIGRINRYGVVVYAWIWRYHDANRLKRLVVTTDIDYSIYAVVIGYGLNFDIDGR